MLETLCPSPSTVAFTALAAFVGLYSDVNYPYHNFFLSMFSLVLEVL